MATVYRAIREADGAAVAVKVLDPRLHEVLGSDRFRREIQILSRLDHPSIVPLLEAGEAGGYLYYVMPFVAGSTLRERLRQDRQLPVDQALEITRSILDALDYAHGHNILHRDIKPENVLLDQGRARLADFGIARAIVRTAGEQLSSTGIVVGTPAYMSPEQAAGDADLDGRSDLYSTGCVLFEMLAGVPPFPGPTSQAVRARHQYEAPPPLRVVRPAVPDGLELAVQTALAKLPADRFPSAAAMRAALDRAVAPPAVARAPPRRGWVVTAAVAAVLGIVAVASWPPDAAPADGYAVVSGGMPSDAGPQFAELLWDSMRRYEDLVVADPAVVRERLPGSLGSRDVGSLRRIGREVGVNRVVEVGATWADGEVRLDVALVRTDAEADEAPTRFSVAVPAAGAVAGGDIAPALREALGRLAAAIVVGRPDLPGLDDLRLTTRASALRAAVAGDTALRAWDLPDALAGLRDAFIADPAYAAARLRYARAALFADRPVSEWKPAAEAALASRDLTPGAREEAAAIAALGAGAFPRACAGFRRLIASDSGSVIGWFGLGECLTRDSIVIADAASPSGWSFRGSHAAGARAYQRALAIAPLSHRAFGPALARLADKLYAESNRPRLGVAEGSGRRFAAYPGLHADTVGFVPWPIDEVLRAERMPATLRDALRANRQALLRITSEWLARFPESPPAMEAHALALELAGDIGPVGTAGGSAVGLVQAVRARDASASRDLARSAWLVRLLVKSRRFTAARHLAESTLARAPVDETEATRLASLAALIGDADRAAALVSHFPRRVFVAPGGDFVEVPLDVAIDARRHEIYAAMGGPADSLRAIAQRLDRLVSTRVESARRELVHRSVTFAARLLAFPVLDPPLALDFPTARIEQRLAQGRTAEARTAMRRLHELRLRQAAGEIAPDHTVLEARLLLIVGDTVLARRRLVDFARALPGLGTLILDEPTQAAAIGRAYALLGSLGAASDVPEADSVVAALWGSARSH